MTQYAYILKSPGEPDEVFTKVENVTSYLAARWVSCQIAGSDLTLQRVLDGNLVVATIKKVRLNPENFTLY